MSDMLGLACGALLGTAFFILLPEADETVGMDMTGSGVVLAGVGLGFLMQLAFHGRFHDHTTENQHGASSIDLKPVPSDTDVSPAGADGSDGGSHAVTKDISKAKTMAWLVLVGDALHNIVDGALIGATFIEDSASGWTVTLAVLLHEIPHEMGDFAVLLRAGWKPTRALLANLGSSLSAVIGMIVALSIGTKHENTTNWFMPFAAGQFIYIALGEILPELCHLPTKQFTRSAVFAALGLTLIGLSTLYDGGHSHGGGGDDHSGHGH